jgi:hypothetical protein
MRVFLHTVLVQPDLGNKTLVTALAVVHVLACSQAGDLDRVEVGLVRVGHHVVLVQVGPSDEQLATQLARGEGTGWFGRVKGGRVRVMDNIVTV